MGLLLGALVAAFSLLGADPGLTLPRRGQDAAGWFRGDVFCRAGADPKAIEGWSELGVGAWLPEEAPPLIEGAHRAGLAVLVDFAVPAVDLRDKPARAAVLRSADEVVARGADGLVLRGLGALGDRSEALRLCSDLKERLAASGALLVADLPGGQLVLDADLGAAIAAAIREQRAAPLLAAEKKRIPATTAAPNAGPSESRALEQALRLLAGGPVFLEPPLEPRVQDILRARREHPALRFGRVEPASAKGTPAVWAVLRHDGADRVLVIANLSSRAAKVSVELPAVGRLEPLAGSPPLPPGRGRASIELGPRELRLYAAERDPRRLEVSFARLEAPARAIGGAVEQGLAFDPERKIGFLKEELSQIACAGEHCAARFEPRPKDPMRWMAELPAGPYAVEVSTRAQLPKSPALRLLGVPIAGAGKKLRAVVFLREGRLSIEPLGARQGGLAIEVEQIKIGPAPFKLSAVEAEVAADRVVLRAEEAGVVEWRMDRSTSEPCEQATLVKQGGRFSATLGPWPTGEVSEVSYVIRAKDGRYLTGPDGRELVTRVR